MNGNGNQARADVRSAAEATVDDALDGAEAVRSSARAEFNRLAADVEDLVRKVAHVTDADIARVRQRVEEKLASTRRLVDEGSARVRAQGKYLAERTDGYVHERPWTALGIAAAVGILIGVLSSRR
jgi:ElaB/YqjD/DUF883 family membrane-anchored ribosome-binding protein